MNLFLAALSLYAFGILISMSAMSITAALVVLSLLIQKFSPSEIKHWYLESQKKDRGFYLFKWATLALFFSCIVSDLIAWMVPVTWASGSAPVQFQSLLKLWYLFWPFVLAYAISKVSHENRAKVLRVWVGTFTLLSIIGIVQYYTGWPRMQQIPHREDAVRYHAVLFLGFHLSVASILIFPFFFVLDAIVDSKLREQLKIPKWFLLLSALAGLLTLYFTYSRTLWFALPCGILLWFLLRLERKKAASIIVACIVLGAVLYRSPQVRERINSPHGIFQRQVLWETNLGFFKKRPLTGVGYGQNILNTPLYISEKMPDTWRPLISHAHNNFLEVLGGTGMFGILSWVFYSVLLIFLCWKRGWRGLACAWVVFQINGMTQVNFWDSKVMHQMMWVTAWALAGL